MESLDPELKTYFSKIKEEIKSEHVQYIRNHPEIRDILNDFLSSLLLEKPEDIYFYARKYFGFFNVEKPVEKHKLLVISGPSGVGKGTLLAKLLKEFPNSFEISVSWTTRSQRVGEINGVSYYFKTKAEFEEEIKNNGFVEFCQVHGKDYYGTHRQVLRNIMEKGKVCILEIDVQGAQKILQQGLEANYVFINAKNSEVLRERLNKRATENPEQIERRLKTAENELKTFKEMPVFHEIVNDEFESSYAEMLKYFQELYPGAFSSEKLEKP